MICGMKSCPMISFNVTHEPHFNYEGKFYSYPLRAFQRCSTGIFRSTLCAMSYAKAKLMPNLCAV